ncbi:MAG: PEP-CTERM sorting domain-containing protein [Phycisphaerae bacterium]
MASSASDWSVHLPTMLDLREGLRARYGLVAFFDGGGGSGIDAFFRAPIEDSAVPNQLPGVTSTAAANAALIEPPARDEPFAPQPNQSSLLDGAPSRFVDPSGPSIDQMVALAGFPGADTPFLPGHSPARDSMVYGPAQPGSVESPLYDAPAVPGAPEVRPPSGNAPGGGNPGMSTNPIPYDPKPLAEPEPLGRMVPEPGAICLLGLGGLLLGKRRR